MHIHFAAEVNMFAGNNEAFFGIKRLKLPGVWQLLQSCPRVMGGSRMMSQIRWTLQNQPGPTV
jgi:hypothetical protein